MLSLSALLLAVVAFLIPFASPRVRNDSSTVKVVVILLIVRQVVSFLQVLVGPLPTVDGDPIGFNAFAMREPFGDSLGRNPYAMFLRSVYDILGASHLLGCEISQVGFSIGLVAFVEMCFLLGLSDRRSLPLFVFGLLPSVLLNTSVVMREGVQVGAFLCLVYGWVAIRKGRVFTGVAVCLVSSVLLIFIHNGFAPYLALVLPLSMLWATGTRPAVLIGALMIATLLVVGFGRGVLDTMQEQSVALDRVMQGQGLEYIGGYQAKVNEGRSAFDVQLDTSSAARFLTTGPVVLVNYLFAPFPWQVRGALDVYGLLESFLRIWLATSAARYFLSKNKKDSSAWYILAMYISMEMVWAAGTANWGTAFRHRVVAWGLLVILGNLRDQTSSGDAGGKRPVGPSPRDLKSIRGRRRALRRAVPGPLPQGK